MGVKCEVKCVEGEQVVLAGTVEIWCHYKENMEKEEHPAERH